MFRIVKVLHLLSLSFFVLFAAAKTDSVKLQKFGRIIAATLCIVAAALLFLSIYLNLIYLLGI